MQPICLRCERRFNVYHSRAVKIKDNLRRSRREIALSYLRSQKLLEELLRKRVTSLETIQSSLMKVETVAGDIEVGSTLFVNALPATKIACR